MKRLEFMTQIAKQERPQNAIERIGDQHALMMRYVQGLADEERERGELERLDPRTHFPETYEGMAFLPDLYVIEPAALDDLEKAKARRDEAEVKKMRSIIRAMSWMSHGRTDPGVAAKKAGAFLKEAEEAEHRATQTGFEFAHPDMAEWARVLSMFEAARKGGSNIECRGEVLEKPTAFVEKKIIETWKDLLDRMKKARQSEWPTSRPVRVRPPKLDKSVAETNERLVDLRHVRDQLYYQLLYPEHCMFARRADIK